METFGPKRIFVKRTITSKLKCPICYDVFQKPRRLFCGHTFCKKCIRQYLKPHKNPQHIHKCPICREVIDVHNIGCDLVAKKIIDQLKVTCPVNGCPWKGHSQLLQTHYNYGCTMKHYITNLSNNKSISLIQEQEEERSAQLAETINQNTQKAALLSRVLAKNPKLMNLKKKREGQEEQVVITEKAYEACVKVLVTRSTQTSLKEPLPHRNVQRMVRPIKIDRNKYLKRQSQLSSMLSSKVRQNPYKFDQSSSYQEEQPVVPIINLQPPTKTNPKARKDSPFDY